MAIKEGPLAAAPAFFIFAALCLSISLGALTGAPLAAAAAVSALFPASALLAGTGEITGGWRSTFCLVILLSLVLSFFSAARMRKEIIFPDNIETHGRILLSREWGKRRALIIETPEGRVAAYTSENLPEGASVKLRGASFDFRRAARRGDFDEKLFWRGKGALKRLELFEIRVTAPPSGLAAWRNRLEALFRTRLYPLSAAYMSVLTTGRRDKSVEAVHERAGTLHLLSVSGFHVGILVWLLFFIFRGWAVRGAAVSLIMWLYIAFVGFPPGGVRAGIMAQMCIAAAVLGRPYSSFNNVSAAASLMLLYNPWSFFDVGWRLSVIAALFITAGAKFAGRGVLCGAALSVLVWFVTAPVAADVFSEVPAAGLLLNIFAVPYFAILFPLVLALCVPSLIGLPFAELPAGVCETALSFSQDALSAAASFFPAGIGFSTPLFAFACAVFCCACALRCGVPPRRVPFIVLFSLSFLLYLRAVL